uniref:vacuolar protein sorting-associated protein VTA1 homolog n=1 Tax=Styela clava TaxID=7725 RepID=UPI00193ABF74|nr:vacuolar protein sorting-associated protein VTA1 homolog [Styela clava]
MAQLPLKLKAIQPFLKVANDMRKKDPVTAYYCDMHAMQTGMKIDSKSPECKSYLIQLMTSLEKQKAVLSVDPERKEQVSSEVVGEALIEEQAMKLFSVADAKDRNSDFGKNVVRLFYTSSVLFDVAEGLCEELGEEASHHRKYARWKATYIHNCLKNGETPQPGPVGGLDDSWEDELENAAAGPSTSHQESYAPPPVPTAGPAQPPAEPPKPVARSKPVEPAPSSYEDPTPSYSDLQTGGAELTPMQFNQAQKLCKYATSAIMYQDIPTAVDNLEKCIRLLKTGKE